jgi:hypothetical protein
VERVREFAESNNISFMTTHHQDAMPFEVACSLAAQEKIEIYDY